MLVARAQLDLVRSFLAEFAGPTSDMRSIALLRAQYVAVVVTLRSVGHVLLKVDADTPAKERWLKARWDAWKVEPIFADFIEPGRNVLLKEARGLLDFSDASVSSPAVVTDPVMPDMVSLLVDFDAAAHRTNRRPTLELFREAVQFWDTRVREAEQAFPNLN